jgi:hypothetical protein
MSASLKASYSSLKQLQKQTVPHNAGEYLASGGF